MKKILFGIILATAVAAFAQQEIDADELTALALKDVAAEAGVSLQAAAAIPAGEPVAILPIADDSRGYVAGILKNTLIQAGKTCVEGKEDPMWDAILAEIEWDERKEDILDPETLDKFGRLKSAKCLMYGSIRRVGATGRYVLVELELHISRIATKEHVWGGVFARRLYAPDKDPQGVVEIPAAVRKDLIDGIRSEISSSLAKSQKLSAVKKVAMLPVAGDFDQYAEGLLRDALSTSSVTPVNLDVQTRAEARFALREGPGKADAIVYGVLRDMSAALKERKPDGSIVYSAAMELQLWIEKGATREILWSDTVRHTTDFTVGGDPMKFIYYAIGAVLVLIIVGLFFRAVTRVR